MDKRRAKKQIYRHIPRDRDEYAARSRGAHRSDAISASSSFRVSACAARIASALVYLHPAQRGEQNLTSVIYLCLESAIKPENRDDVTETPSGVARKGVGLGAVLLGVLPVACRRKPAPCRALGTRA